jgi:hypothetical protein
MRRHIVVAMVIQGIARGCHLDGGGDSQRDGGGNGLTNRPNDDSGGWPPTVGAVV